MPSNHQDKPVCAHANLLKHILVWVCLFVYQFSSVWVWTYLFVSMFAWVCVCVYVQYHFPTRFLVNVGWWRQSTKLSNGELILALPPSLCAFHLLLTLAHSHPSQPMSYTASAPFLSIFLQIVRKKLTKHIGACTCVHLHWDFKKVKFFNRYIG